MIYAQVTEVNASCVTIFELNTFYCNPFRGLLHCSTFCLPVTVVVGLHLLITTKTYFA